MTDSTEPFPAMPDTADTRPLSQQARPAPPYLNGLNPEQREAVETLDGPVLVLAGAGTGKTRVLTTRLAHILTTGRAWPSQILAVTFTNKAAREMRERVAGLIGQAVEGLPWLGTFHAIGAQILRRHAEIAGLKPSFTILDVDDQLRLIRQILQAENIDEKRWTPRHFAGVVDGWKNRGLGPDQVGEEDRWLFAEGKAVKLYELYQQRLATLNAVDFGDLLLLNLKIFQSANDVLDVYHKKFKYLLVDEYQDTNVAQYLWLRLLARGSNNLCCVGDDDQSIYGWRGAEVDNILRFERDFPGAKEIRLERNYRSTQHILSAASGLIAANQARLGKTLWTEDQGGDKVRVKGVWDGEAEARTIADEIENWVSKDRPYADCAVLVRASHQMRAFEERFLMIGVPYKVIGGPRFFERAEIRDAHAYLRLARSNDDDLAFERVVNTPTRGIGETSVRKLQVAARSAGVSLAEAARVMVETDEIRGKARTALKTFLQDIARWRELGQSAKHVDLAEQILDESGYTAMWREDKSPQAQSRLDNLKELVQAMGEFDTLEAYLEHVSLVAERAEEPGGDEVSLMTLHSAKGLEFPMVFLPGWEEELFPSKRALDEGGVASLEEERRLAYVGLTRARERAMVSFAANRQIYGRWQAVIPSRFIDELPPAHVEAESDTGYYDTAGPGFAHMAEPADPFRSDYQSPGWKRLQASKDRPRSTPPTINGEARVIATTDPAAPGFPVGSRVFHQKFGYGRVLKSDGAKLTVDFEKAGQKKVVASFVNAA
ncbi:MAG: ATP-dependent helicase [Maricaulaceae bacterium]